MVDKSIELEVIVIIGDMMRKYISIVVIVLILISCVINVYAQNTAEIVSEVINQNIKDEQLIAIHIRNNPGIMGFKLHLEYPKDSVEIVSVNKGEVTSGGNFNNNIGNKDGGFDIMWNNTTDTILNGTIAVLKVKVLTEEPFKIKLSFSQPDTFNGNYEDIVFLCNDIVSSNYMLESDTSETVTEKTDEETTITEDLMLDIITDALKENDVTSYENIESGIKDKVISTINQQIEILSNQKEYYKDFDEVKDAHTSLLKDNLIKDANSLITEDSPEEIIEQFKENNKYKDINSENVGELLEFFEEKGLDKKYSDYLSEEDLLNVFNQSSVGDIQENNTQNNQNEIGNSQKTLLILIVIVLLIIIVCMLKFLKERQKKNEKK